MLHCAKAGLDFINWFDYLRQIPSPDLKNWQVKYWQASGGL
jgi:hypothetical protein